jgi:hypothetical protein
MSGVVQSEYQIPRERWAQIISILRKSFIVSFEEANHAGHIGLLELKLDDQDRFGVTLDVITGRGVILPEGTLMVAMHWLHKSPGPDKNVSRRLAAKIETILKANGAECSHSPVDSEEP